MPPVLPDYKASLNNLFDNIGRTSSEADQPASKELARRPGRMLKQSVKSDTSIYLEAISRSCTQDEITNSYNALISAGLPLPDDEDLLSKGLTHKSEEVALKLAQRLSELLETQTPKNPRLLRSRLENAASFHSSLRMLLDTMREKCSIGVRVLAA